MTNNVFVRNESEEKPLYKKVKVKGESWVKGIVKRLLNGTFDTSDIGLIVNLKEEDMIDNIYVTGNIIPINTVRRAFADLAEAVNGKSPFHKDIKVAFDKFNSTMQNSKAPRTIESEFLG